VARRPSLLGMRSGEGDIYHNPERRGIKMAKFSGHPQPVLRTTIDIDCTDPATGCGFPACT